MNLTLMRFGSSRILGGHLKTLARLNYLPVVAGVFAIAVSTSGCSYLEQFFIVNSSLEPLTVVAAASVYPRADTGERICAWSFRREPPTEFKGIEAAQLRRDYIPLDQFTKTAIAVFDDPLCSVRVTVEPGVAALVWSSSNGGRTPFLTTVAFGDGAEVVEGSDVLKRFRKRSRAVYVLEHK